MDRSREARKARSALDRIADRVWGIKKRKKREPKKTDDDKEKGEPKKTGDDKEEKERTVVLVGDGSFGDT